MKFHVFCITTDWHKQRDNDVWPYSMQVRHSQCCCWHLKGKGLMRLTPLSRRGWGLIAQLGGSDNALYQGCPISTKPGCLTTLVGKKVQRWRWKLNSEEVRKHLSRGFLFTLYERCKEWSRYQSKLIKNVFANVFGVVVIIPLSMLCWLCHDFFVKLQCTVASNKGGICSVISTCLYFPHHYNHPMSCHHTTIIFVAITDNIITIIPDNVITNAITKVTIANKVDICTSVITTCSAPLTIIHIHENSLEKSVFFVFFSPKKWNTGIARKLPSITKVGKSSGTLPWQFSSRKSCFETIRRIASVHPTVSVVGAQNTIFFTWYDFLSTHGRILEGRGEWWHPNAITADEVILHCITLLYTTLHISQLH